MRSRIRHGTVLGLFFLAFVVVFLRAFQLQIIPEERVQRLVQRQLRQKIEIVGRRGTIVDRKGKELAVSINSMSVFANPKLIKNIKQTTETLARLLKLPAPALEKKLRDNSEKKFIWLARQLSDEQMNGLKTFNLKQLEGIGTLPEYRREYPLDSVAAHVLGFVDVDGKGLAGIERKFDESLSGSKNTIIVERDNWGRPIFSRREQIQLEEEQGEPLQITIDADLQFLVEKYLKESVEEHRAVAGSVIVMEPHTGGVVALANYPTFDLNTVKESSENARKNRALLEPIEPGSVFKPFVVSQALEKHVVTSHTIIATGNGSIKIGKKTISEADEKHYFSQLSVKDILRYSSNVGTIQIMRRMGWPLVNEMIEKLGVAEVTGIELPGESRGIYRSPKASQLLEQATISYGQGIALTPIQVVSAYAVLANGGTKVRPTLVYAKKDLDSPPERIFSESTTREIRKILESVVEEEGTGSLAKVASFQVAGKTGTARKVDFLNGGYEKGAYWSSFAGLIPSDHPRFVIYVMLDDPRKGSFYGGSVAAPLFSKVALAALRSGDGQETQDNKEEKLKFPLKAR